MFGVDRWGESRVKRRSGEIDILEYHEHREIEYIYCGDYWEIVIWEEYFDEFLFRDIVYDFLRELYIRSIFESSEIAQKDRILR